MIYYRIYIYIYTWWNSCVFCACSWYSQKAPSLTQSLGPSQPSHTNGNGPRGVLLRLRSMLRIPGGSCHGAPWPHMATCCTCWNSDSSDSSKGPQGSWDFFQTHTAQIDLWDGLNGWNQATMTPIKEYKTLWHRHHIQMSGLSGWTSRMCENVGHSETLEKTRPLPSWPRCHRSLKNVNFRASNRLMVQGDEISSKTLHLISKLSSSPCVILTPKS